MTEENTLVKADFSTHEVFTNPDVVNKIIADVQAKVNDLDLHDPTTKEGRKAIKAQGREIGKTRIFIEGHGKTLAAAAKAIPKQIDEGRKKVKDAIQKMQDDHIAEVVAYEEAEKARKEANAAKVKAILSLDCGDPATETLPAFHLDAKGVQERIDGLRSLDIGPDWEEEQGIAELQREEVLKNLSILLESKTTQEAERAELEKLKAEAEAKAQAEREERIRAEAAAKAKEEAAAEIERAKLAEEQATQREAEQVKRAEEAEQKAKEAAEAKPDPKPANPDAKAMNGAYKGLVEYGISKQEARELVKAIKAGELPNIAIV